MVWKASEARCTAGNEPDFTRNPEGWFEWFDSCITDEPGDVDTEGFELPCKPVKLQDQQGRCWRVVCTSDGPEFRPCWGEEIGEPRAIVAVQARADGYSVLVNTSHGHPVQDIPAGRLHPTHLIRAMVHHISLPGDLIREVEGSFWEGLTPVKPVSG
jgi:hypothetical protein